MFWAKAGSCTPTAKSYKAKASASGASSILGLFTRLGSMTSIVATCKCPVDCLTSLATDQGAVPYNWASTLILKLYRRPQTYCMCICLRDYSGYSRRFEIFYGLAFKYRMLSTIWLKTRSAYTHMRCGHCHEQSMAALNLLTGLLDGDCPYLYSNERHCGRQPRHHYVNCRLPCRCP